MTNKIEITELKLSTVDPSLSLKVSDSLHISFVPSDVRLWRCDSTEKLIPAGLQSLRNAVFVALDKLDSSYIRALETTDGSRVTLNRGQISLEFFEDNDFSWLSNSAYSFDNVLNIGNSVKTFLSDIKTALAKSIFFGGK